jgi:PAS domain S-box-containing protein
MTGRDAAEDGEEAALADSIRLSPIATVLSNPRRPDNPIVAADAAFCALTGYEEREIVGRNCRFLAGPGTEPWLTERIRQALRDHSLSSSLGASRHPGESRSPGRPTGTIRPGVPVSPRRRAA